MTYLSDRIPRLAETQIREALATKYKLRPLIFETPTLEIDIILAPFTKPQIIGEIKWKNNI